jgi:hypothetical protein
MVALSLGVTLMGACKNWRMDSSALTAHQSTLAQGPSCASCHGYPLKDINHNYHLFEAGSLKLINGPITCLDCHSTAMRFTEVTLRDTLYRDTDGGRWSTLEYPVLGSDPSIADTLRTFSLDSIVVLTQHRPIRMPARPGPQLKVWEYMTGLAHMNNTVDVVFASNVSTPEAFNGQRAVFNPTQETCSAVACHGNARTYRWAAPSKGLDSLQ